jgi:hypothetical protein
MKVSNILERELKEVGKELGLIAAGKITPQDYNEYKAEIKAKHSGKHKGLGKKT